MAKTSPQTTAQLTERKPTIPGLPAYLIVGNGSRARSSRAKVGVEQLRKLFGWWTAAQPSLKQLSAQDIGIPALKLAEEFGMLPPMNGNSFRANLQRIFDELSIDGKTMFLSLRGAGEDKFRVLPETMVWFHPVPSAERGSSRGSK
jgi:hypothetical protein